MAGRDLEIVADLGLGDGDAPRSSPTTSPTPTSTRTWARADRGRRPTLHDHARDCIGSGDDRRCRRGRVRRPGRHRPGQRAAILVEALPYIRRFAGAIVVVKYGGNAMGDAALAAVVRRGHRAAARGRPAAGRRPRRRAADRRAAWPGSGKEPEFRDGLRVTDAETLDIARMVLGGKVNRDDRRRPSTATTAWPSACRGEDAGLIVARQRDAELGFVGDVADVDRRDPRHAARRGLHPGDLDHRHRRRRAGLQHQRRQRGDRHRRGAARPRSSST